MTAIVLVIQKSHIEDIKQFQLIKENVKNYDITLCKTKTSS